jgi:hypothetical protein
MLLFSLIICSYGVFRYQEVAALARDAARWASVHGSQYATDSGQAAATQTDVYNNVISTEATGLDLTKLNYSVTWPQGNDPYDYVQVTITYQWIPEAYFGGLSLTSTSKCTIQY